MLAQDTFALMRSILLLFAIVALVGSSAAFAGSSKPSVDPAQDTVEQIQPGVADTATSLAPWAAPTNAKAPAPVTLKDEHSNAALYGWLFVSLAALGMSVFVWRSIKKA